MPRSKQVNTYHFKVDYSSEESDDEEVKTKYFTTMEEISTHFNVSRSTLYNYQKHTTENKKRKNNFIKNITKLEEPQPVYKKIMVHFD